MAGRPARQVGLYAGVRGDEGEAGQAVRWWRRRRLRWRRQQRLNRHGPDGIHDGYAAGEYPALPAAYAAQAIR